MSVSICTVNKWVSKAVCCRGHKRVEKKLDNCKLNGNFCPLFKKSVLTMVS